MSEYITTYTGKHFKPTEPDPELFDIADIAHALSLICRGNGHVKTFWSVGEHCICCAKEAKARGLSDRMVLACLLHDASECYMSDVPSPFKKELPEYNEREERMLSMIYEKFLGSDLTPEEKMQLNAIDKAMLWYDLTFLLGEKQESEAPELHIDLRYEVRAFGEVEEEYRSIFCVLQRTLPGPGMDLCSGLQTEGNRPGDPRIWGTFQTLSAYDICLHGCGLYRGSRRSCRTWEDSNGQ